jgi:hypothetical protein
VISALFNPLRRWVQVFVDQRFYRRKDDAAKTLEAFSVKLRDETDLDALSEDLVGVVRRTYKEECALRVILFCETPSPSPGAWILGRKRCLRCSFSR